MDDRALAEEAAGWLIRLEEGAGPACKAEFAAWAARSPAHMEQFLLVTAASRELDGLDCERNIDVERLLRTLPAENAAGVVPLRDAAWPPRPAAAGRRRWRIAAALAASLPVLAVAIWLLLPGAQAQRFATALGEQRSIKLNDDSVVQMNTQSQVEVRLSDESREVRLIEGEALFAVARDPSRPFRVLANGAVIQAVGTQFNVYRKGVRTIVAVVEGAVNVSTPSDPGRRLGAGDVASIGESGGVELSPARQALDQVVWRQRKLDFRGTRLDEVVEQFNRYNRARMRIEDPRIAQRQLNGVFNADEPRALLEFLAQDPAVRFEERDGEVVIRAR
jgi:transmembrane sensor